MSESATPVPPAFAQALTELGLTSAGPWSGQALTGGVSSDIWRIDTERGPVCAKRALTKLRVAADWQAPIERNRYEARWMEVAEAAVPGCTPQLLGQHPAFGVLVMRYLSPADHPLWKSQLRDGQVDLATADAVGRTLARIHAYAAARPELAPQFDTDAIFFDIRLAPYLLATAARHPDLAAPLEALVAQTQTHKRTLVHGDVSPKNILVGAAGPVLLDAECAWWGDPAFDIAFCLNHLLLKCLWRPTASAAFLSAFQALADAYLDGVDWEPRAAVEARAARLLPGLLLARVDGKSPVEYLTDDAQRDIVRRTRAPAAAAAGRAPVTGLRRLARRDPAMTLDTTITSVHARRVWDSRGRPTVEAEVGLHDGSIGRAIVPAGASKGSREALELRDGGAAFGGLDVQRAVAHVNGEIAQAVRGLAAQDQGALDAALIALDGSTNKSRLGANATLAVSMAAAHATAAARGLPLYASLGGDQAVRLPMPQIQIFGGGAHAGRRVDIQDFMVVCPGATSFSQALEWTAEVYRHAGQLMMARGASLGVADEGGWWPAFDTNEAALETLVQAIEAAGFAPGAQVGIALDIAASDFGRGGRYTLGLERRELDSDGLIELLLRWCERFPILSIEDPLAEDDPDGFARFTKAVQGRLQVVGDDFLVSSAALLREAAAAGAANTVLLKPNQRGTLSETRECWQAAQALGYAGIVSARSGETEDLTIVHLAIGWQVGQLKVGSFARGERMAKWNEALRIEERLGASARFAGGGVFPGWSAAG